MLPKDRAIKKNKMIKKNIIKNKILQSKKILEIIKFPYFKKFFFKRLQLDFYKEKELKILSKLKRKKKYRIYYQDESAIFVLNTDPIIKKFLNILMKKGNKAKAEKIFFSILVNIRKVLKKNPYYWFKKGLFMLQSYMWLQKIKRFKTNVTPEVTSFKHNISRSSKNLIKYASLRIQERSIDEQIAKEILETLKKKSVAFKKKGELERIIVFNRINTRWRYK